MTCVLCDELHMNDPPLSGLRILNGIPKKPQIQICYKSKFLCVEKREREIQRLPRLMSSSSVLYALFSIFFLRLQGPFTPSVRSILQQLCDDASDTVLIENYGVTSDGVCNPFSSDSIVFNENSIASIIAALMPTLGVNGPSVTRVS